MRTVRNIGATAMLGLLTTGSAWAQTFYVDPAGVGVTCTATNPCPLIASALALAGAGATVSLAPGTYTEAGLSVTNDITIVGAGAFTTIVDATGLNQRIFNVSAGNVVIDKVTLQNASIIGQNGAAIQVTSGDLTVSRSRLIGNNAAPGGAGGAIAANAYAGTITLVATSVEDNNAGFDGGGIWCYGCDGVKLVLSKVANNTAGGLGGGVMLYLSELTTWLSSVSHNTADIGGGVHANYATVQLLDSEVSDNTADSSDGGGVWIAGQLNVERSTLARNTATTSGAAVYFYGAGIFASSNSTYSGNTALCGGGLYLFANFGLGPDVRIGTSTFVGNTSSFAGCANHIIQGANFIELYNSILSGGTAGNPACSAPMTGGNTNLIADATCDTGTAGFNLGAVTGLNGALAYNGGFARTHMISAASNAVNAGTNAACVNPWLSWYGPPFVPLFVDERALPRALTLANPCDIGAVERQ